MTRGGFRAGSGRKSSWNNSDTQLIRVPRIFAAQLLEIARRLDAGDVMELLPESVHSPAGVATESIDSVIDPDVLSRMVQEILSDHTVAQDPVEQDAARRALYVFIDRLMQ